MWVPAKKAAKILGIALDTVYYQAQTGRIRKKRNPNHNGSPIVAKWLFWIKEEQLKEPKIPKEPKVHEPKETKMPPIAPKAKPHVKSPSETDSMMYSMMYIVLRRSEDGELSLEHASLYKKDALDEWAKLTSKGAYCKVFRCSPIKAAMVAIGVDLDDETPVERIVVDVVEPVTTVMEPVPTIVEPPLASGSTEPTS